MAYQYRGHGNTQHKDPFAQSASNKEMNVDIILELVLKVCKLALERVGNG